MYIANIEICMQKKLGFFEYYVRILALKIEDNLIWYGTLCLKNNWKKDIEIKLEICVKQNSPCSMMFLKYTMQYTAHRVCFRDFFIWRISIWTSISRKFQFLSLFSFDVNAFFRYGLQYPEKNFLDKKFIYFLTLQNRFNWFRTFF